MTMTPTAGKRRSLKDLKVGHRAKEWPDKVKFADMADNPDNPRSALRELEGLAATIKESGILQALVLVPRENWLTAHPEHDKPIEDGGIGDKPFVILIGHRRRHAAELAGIDEAPVRIREDVATTSRRNALIENVQRDDLTPLEEAHAIRDLIQEEDISQREAAAILGKTQPWVSQRLTLLGLIPEQQAELSEGRLRVEDARKLGKLLPELQLAVHEARLSLEDGLEIAKRPQADQRMPEPREPDPPAGGGEQADHVGPAAVGDGTVPPPVPDDPKSGRREAVERHRPPQDDSLDEALALEGAIVTASNKVSLRALRRIAQNQPDLAARILGHMEEAARKMTAAANELRADLETPARG
jgi:ParB family chromosome partitioning protein